MLQAIDRLKLLFSAHAVARMCCDAAGLFNCAKDNAHSPRRAFLAQVPPRAVILLRSITGLDFLHHVQRLACHLSLLEALRYPSCVRSEDTALLGSNRSAARIAIRLTGRASSLGPS